MPGSRAAAFPIGAAATLAQLEADPHRLLFELREREPVSWLPVLGAWLVTRRDLALAVMRDADSYTVDDPRFSTGRVVGPSMLTLDGDEHARHRAPFGPAFRRDAVHKCFTEPVVDQTDRLIDAMAPAGAAELRGALAGPLAAAVVMQSLGLGAAGTAQVLGWYRAIADAVTDITAGGELCAGARAAFAQLRAALEPAIADRERNCLLADAAGPGAGLTQSEVVSNAAVFLFGGIETTEAMIANAIWFLLADPPQLARIRADPAQIENAVEESLRLEPGAASVDRYATADVALGGAGIRAGELVSVSIAAANRDPATFADPDRFDAARANARLHLAFAHGPHVCIGMHLARLEAHTAVGRLLKRLPRLRLDPDRPSAPRGLVFRKPPHLHVLWS